MTSFWVLARRSILRLRLYASSYQTLQTLVLSRITCLLSFVRTSLLIGALSLRMVFGLMFLKTTHCLLRSLTTLTNGLSEIHHSLYVWRRDRLVRSLLVWTTKRALLGRRLAMATGSHSTDEPKPASRQNSTDKAQTDPAFYPEMTDEELVQAIAERYRRHQERQKGS